MPDSRHRDSPQGDTSPSDPRPGLPGPLLHGVLDLCLLALLAAQRDYGYGLAQRLEATGFGEVPGGTLYPALLRLERHGLVAISWQPSDAGPRRKYYAVTAAGRAAFSERADQWDTFSRNVSGLVGTARRHRA